MFEHRVAEEGLLESLGLVGDGDEVDAVRDVERCFDVVLDYGHAGEWRTVGDVHAALASVLPPERRCTPACGRALQRLFPA
jgi:hypothetical protein